MWRVSLHKMVSGLLAHYFMGSCSLQSLSKLGILTYQNKAESYIETLDCEKVPINPGYNHYRFEEPLDNCSGPVRACGECLCIKWLAACLLAIL